MIAGKTAGRISIGAVSTAKYFVPFAISGFSRLYPKVDISLSIGNRQEIGTALRGYDLDIAIMGRPPADVPMNVHLIGDHPHVIIAPTGHRLARKARLALSDLAGETFLTREPGSGTRGLMEQLFETARVRPTIGMAMSSNETIKQAVIAGLGIAFISAHTVATELDERRLVTLDVDRPARGPAMVRPFPQGQGPAAAGAGDVRLSERRGRAIPAAHPRQASAHPRPPPAPGAECVCRRRS